MEVSWIEVASVVVPGHGLNTVLKLRKVDFALLGCYAA
jgi:hypothetical protein